MIPGITAGRPTNNSFSDYQGLVLSYGPTSYWPMNEVSGTVAYDVSGRNFHGTVAGGPLMGQMALRRGGRSMGFGIAAASAAKVVVSTGVSQARFAQLDRPGSSWTICMWVNVTATTTYNWMIASWANSFSGPANFRTQINNGQAPDNSNVVGFPIALNTTTFIVYRKNAATGKINGMCNATFLADVNYVTVNNTVGSENLEFPASGNGNWTYYPMRGYMSDVAIYERALTNTELQTMYDIGKLT